MSTPATLLEVRIARKYALTSDICCLELVAAAGTLPAFSAGAHIDVHLSGPDGEIVRPYSLCSAPGDSSVYQIAVLREPDSRGGSTRIHDMLAEGDRLRIGAPVNHFALAPDAPHHLLLAGGIGITPLLAMAEELAAGAQAFALHHATRSRARTPFLERIAGSAFARNVVHHVGDGDGTSRLDMAATLQQAPAGSHLYVCGPQRFIDAALDCARAQGWAPERLHHEYFTVAPADTTGDGAFELEIASTGQVITVLPAQTALQALHAAGLEIPMSCEEGVCGTCLTGVKAGTPLHRDHYLTTEEQAEGKQFLPCCSRSCDARLVLDL